MLFYVFYAFIEPISDHRMHYNERSINQAHYSLSGVYSGQFSVRSGGNVKKAIH